MPLQVKPNIAPVRGLKYNLAGTLVDDDQMTECRNMVIDRVQNAAKGIGYVILGGNLPLDSAIVGIQQFVLSNGGVFLVVETLTKVYYYNTGTGNWVDITGTALTGTTDNLFSSTVMNDLLILSNGKDAMKKWTGSGNTAALGGTPPIAKFVKSYKNYIIAAYTTETGTIYPYRLRWCDTGLPESWTPGVGSNAGAKDLNETTDFVTGLTILGDWIIVFKQSSIYAGYPVAANSANQIFQFDIKISGTGCSASGTIANLKNVVLFMGYDNIYSFDGITIDPIGNDIKDALFDMISPSKITNSHALLIQELDEYHLFIPTGSNTTPDTEFIYNYRNKAWTRGTKAAVSTGFYTKQTNFAWNTSVGTWEAQTLAWNSKFLSSVAPTNIYGTSGGYVFQQDYSRTDLNGTAVDAYFDTKDFTIGSWDKKKWFSRLEMYGTGTSVDMYYSIDEGNSWVSLGTYDLDPLLYTPVKVDFRVVSDKIRFRFRNPRIETFRIRMFSVYWDQEGRI